MSLLKVGAYGSGLTGHQGSMCPNFPVAMKHKNVLFSDDMTCNKRALLPVATWTMVQAVLKTSTSLANALFARFRSLPITYDHTY